MAEKEAEGAFQARSPDECGVPLGTVDGGTVLFCNQQAGHYADHSHTWRGTLSCEYPGWSGKDAALPERATLTNEELRMIEEREAVGLSVTGVLAMALDEVREARRLLGGCLDWFTEEAEQSCGGDAWKMRDKLRAFLGERSKP